MNLKDFEKQTFLYKANLVLDGIVYTSKKSFNTYKEAWKYCQDYSPENGYCEFFVTEVPSLTIVCNQDLEIFKDNNDDSKAE